MDLNGLFDSGIDVVFTRIFGEHQVNRERSTGDDENGHVAEEIGEFGRIHGGRSDDQLQILAASYHLKKKCQQFRSISDKIVAVAVPYVAQ